MMTPLPSWTVALYPQHWAEPASVTAQVKRPPEETLTALAALALPDEPRATTSRTTTVTAVAATRRCGKPVRIGIT
jgi:hypothetical protein